MATNEKMVEAVVARNRTIHDCVIVREADKEKNIALEVADVIKTAGQKVRLPESEVVRLRALGYLLPAKVEEVTLEGARISGGQVSINEAD
ncbi:hypothetical protein QCE63_32125 [Caballeronia sp. LZ065]|uniref:hypothetical protein n=1 Tax=Caballeronia sp. LZ065 TaxID=3038571 RepID=UPI002859AC76|nr:hypothetical protein [Caballeronia sp. LZ065]MDR5784069.1 hypothetical protein [Caballeronia sp. LZ065]